ncbi:hypothetical protein [Collimonas silvisoli]|uniref:hypothetical protein n=1 Tax=Collimonas silvisoli TaxID=2825884 RepID=UPI001B8C22C1|nr:hypothetical protein [Collimonas silvisoli]
MNCVSTPNQIATTLPRPQSLLGDVLQAVKNNWWRQRLIPAQPAATQPGHLLDTREMNDHLLRDIGYLDSLPPREYGQRDAHY